MYLYSIIFIPKTAKNTYEGITYSDRNLSAEMTAINCNQNIIMFHALPLHAFVFTFLFIIPTFTSLSPVKLRIALKRIIIL